MSQCGMSCRGPSVPRWSVCTPVVRLYRPVTTNRSDACLIQINVLLSLPARRHGDISSPERQNSPFFGSLSLSFPARRKRQQETREEESVVTSELQQVRSGHGVSLRTCGSTSFSHRPVFLPPGPSRPPAGGTRAGAPRPSASHVSEAFTTHGFSTKTNTKPTFYPLGFRMSMSPNFTPSRTPHRRTSPVDGRQRTQISDARLTRSSFFLLDPQCGGGVALF